jgi:hypothetical protein
MKVLIMEANRILVSAIMFFMLSATGTLWSQARPAGTDNLDEVLRIINFLEEATAYRQTNGHFQGKTAEFSETQVSVFFQYLFLEESSALRSLELKLFPKNKIEGHIVLSLKEKQLPSYIKDEINLYFEARIETNRRKIRLNFKSLFLETQEVQPEAINALIDLVSGSQGLESQHLDQWYDLPEGINELKTAEGRLIVLY